MSEIVAAAVVEADIYAPVRLLISTRQCGFAMRVMPKLIVNSVPIAGVPAVTRVRVPPILSHVYPAAQVIVAPVPAPAPMANVGLVPCPPPSAPVDSDLLRRPLPSRLTENTSVAALLPVIW